MIIEKMKYKKIIVYIILVLFIPILLSILKTSGFNNTIWMKIIIIIFSIIIIYFLAKGKN